MTAAAMICLKLTASEIKGSAICDSCSQWSECYGGSGGIRRARTIGVAWLCGGLLVDAMPAPPSCVQDAEINHVESSQFGICVWSEDCKYT
jgi:hypothetical protein